MTIDPIVESRLQEHALIYMQQSRPEWNVPHLHAAIFYMKELLKAEQGNERVALPAIYLHDVGYAGMLQKQYTFEDNEKVKKLHMEVGAEMCPKILNEIGGFSDEEIQKISYIVGIHDTLEKIQGDDAQLVFEADSLAQVDKDRVKPNFDKESYGKWLDYFITKRVPLFKTSTGKKYLDTLLVKAKNYY